MTNLVEITSGSTCSGFDFHEFESPSDKSLFRPKNVKSPSIKTQTLKSSRQSMAALSLPAIDNFNNKSLYEPVNDWERFSIADSTASQTSCSDCFAYISSTDELMEGNPSEKASWDQSELKVQDLNTLLKHNETDDSALAQHSALIALRKNPDHDNKGCLDDNPSFTNAFGNLTLDQKSGAKLSEKTEFLGNISSDLQNSCFQQHSNCSVEVNSSTFSVSESPSLADLLQQHQRSKSYKAHSSDHLSAGFINMELGSSSLSQISSQPQSSSRLAELSGSLSSLAFSKTSPVRELESLSLSDLITKSIELDKPQVRSQHSVLHAVKMMPAAVTNSDIDLSILIRKSASSPKCEEVQTGTLLPETEVLLPKQGQQLFLASKKSKKRLKSHFLESSISWTKALSARPSAFALTLCLRYPPKRCKHQTVNFHKTFSYSTQMQEVKINEIGPLLAITPFDFKTPSPDDIVKAGQKRAFTR